MKIGSLSLFDILFLILMITCLVVWIIFFLVHSQTSETVYMDKPCVDGEGDVNLDGIMCYKKLSCGGIPSFFDDMGCPKDG